MEVLGNFIYDSFDQKREVPGGYFFTVLTRNGGPGRDILTGWPEREVLEDFTVLTERKVSRKLLFYSLTEMDPGGYFFTV